MRKLDRKTILVSVILIVSIVLIGGIGGKVMFDRKEEKKEQELLAVEKQSVKVLKNTFADIAEVKFEQTGFNSMTGSYRMLVTMTNLEGKSVYFSYGFWKEQNELGDYGVEDRSIQVQGVTNGEVKVTYSDGSEGMV